jgi:hypothetical protein
MIEHQGTRTRSSRSESEAFGETRLRAQWGCVNYASRALYPYHAKLAIGPGRGKFRRDAKTDPRDAGATPDRSCNRRKSLIFRARWQKLALQGGWFPGTYEENRRFSTCLSPLTTLIYRHLRRKCPNYCFSRTGLRAMSRSKSKLQEIDAEKCSYRSKRRERRTLTAKYTKYMNGHPQIPRMGKCGSNQTWNRGMRSNLLTEGNEAV